MITFLTLVSVAIVVWILCFLFSSPDSWFYVLDKPNNRSLHDVPKPRTGGMAIFLVVFSLWLIIIFTQNLDKYFYYLLAGMFILAVISFIDDRYPISQILRLCVHIFAATLLVIGGVEINFGSRLTSVFGWYDFLFGVSTILVIAWVINLYNFMDGIDGLAGGMGLIGFGCLGVLGWLGGDDLYMLMAFIVAASNLGFLMHNFPPAKIFMGDVGSITLGYLVAFFSLWGFRANLIVWWCPVLIFSPFIVDASVTLARRLLHGEKIWEAHKSHYYQKLVQNGWGHRKTAIFEYILMTAVAASVILMQFQNNSILTACFLLFWALMYFLIIALISLKRANFRNSH